MHLTTDDIICLFLAAITLGGIAGWAKMKGSRGKR